MSRLVRVLKTPKLEYKQGLFLQNYIAHKFNSPLSEEQDFRDVLIITEHEPVYTIGIRTKNYSIEEEERLKKLGAQFYKTNRGGLITFHGPGQLIAYPIVHLKHFTPSMRWFVKQLESVIIAVCKRFNITATSTSDTGVWVDDRKICSIGVHGSRYITSHGLALNCNTDLKWFDHIVPCGLEGKAMTSLSNELHSNVDREKVVPVFKECFAEYFKCDVVDLEKDEEAKILRELKSCQ